MVRYLSVLMLVLLARHAAYAACTVPTSSAALGTVSSFSINNTVNATSGNVNVNCGASTSVGVISSDHIYLSLYGASNASGGRAVMTTAGSNDAIPLQVCSTANCSTELMINGAAAMYNSSQLLSLVGLLGGANFSIPLYLRTMTGRNVTAGTYTVTLNILVNYSICTGVGALGQCLPGMSQAGTAMTPVVVTLTITNDCITITAPNVSFGSASVISDFNPISQSISVVCTKGSSYTVGLGNGANAVNSVRYMASNGRLLGYDIYKAAGSARWGPSGGDRWSSALSSLVSSDGTLRTYNYVARILPNQATPPAGNYADNVVVDLSF